MDSVCFDDKKQDIDVKSTEEFSSSDIPGVDDKCQDPEVLPRVGDQYQAEIPPLTAVPVNMADCYSLGLPIPLKWGCCKFESSCGSETLESVTSEEGQVIFEHECPKVRLELQTALLGEGKNVGGFSHFQSSSESDEMDNDSSCKALRTDLNLLRDKYLLPGLLPDQSWTDIEYNSFLLGLYIFGKNLTFLKRFVGSKSVGDILYLYYGKFYRSKEYSRWSECRKMRTRRCIFGQKIFTGWRQQELLSRLFSNVSGECQTILVEISRNFGEGKIPFEDYIFSLKDAVGLDLLISAVSIGKWKKDLTGTSVEPPKTNQNLSVRPEIPIGKACCSLTSADIIKFLTGHYRLSKARSSDLFWEAVWPRLLAKGWHSEQPNDQVVSGSKPPLLFLIPGVKKFSRRKLIKGDHYFDSISDVLNKIASDPGLLETEIQATESSVEREIRQESQDLDGVSNRQQCHYLQSRSSRCNQDLKKFTVVDTSMFHDMDQRKVTQMRSLPFQTTSMSTISSCSSESERDMSENSEDRVELANASSPIIDQVEQANSSSPIEDQVGHANSSNHVGELSDKGMSTESSDCTRSPEALNAAQVEVNNHEFHSDLHNDDHSREINENHLIQKMAPDCTKYSLCIEKMQKLRACNHGEFSQCSENTSVDRKFDLNEPILPSILHEASEGSPNVSNEGSVTENHLVGEVSAENSRTRMLIDLNFPQIPPELGIEMQAPSSMVILQNENQCVNTLSSPSEITQLNEMQVFPDGCHQDQQFTIVNRRQSTRNRPLTTKALEALEYNFVNSKRKGKNTESSDNNSKSQRLRVNSGTLFGVTCDDGIGNSIADARAKEEDVIRTYSCSINLNTGSL